MSDTMTGDTLAALLADPEAARARLAELRAAQLRVAEAEERLDAREAELSELAADLVSQRAACERLEEAARDLLALREQTRQDVLRRQRAARR